MTNRLFNLVCIILIVAAVIWVRQCLQPPVDSGPSLPYYDTIRTTWVDTIPYHKPVPKDSIIKKYIPVFDTTIYTDTVRDTLYTYIPIYQYHFQDKSYNLYVSGYGVTLDSLYVYPEHKTIQLPPVQHCDDSRFSLGLQGGVTLINGKPQFYLGAGLSYNLYYFKKK